MSLPITIMLSVCFLLFFGTTACTGECTLSGKEYLRTIERGITSTAVDTIPSWGAVLHALECLIYNPLDPNRWAGPRTAAYFASLRESPLRSRIAAACTQYLIGNTLIQEGRDALAFGAACALAMFGVMEAEGKDIFSLLAKDGPPFSMRHRHFALASLGDARTLPLLQAEYDSLSAAEHSRDIRSRKIQLLNCLYHVRSDSVLPFIRMIVATDPDSAVVERAQGVLDGRQK